jgi:hypothetical protein
MLPIREAFSSLQLEQEARGHELQDRSIGLTPSFPFLDCVPALTSLCVFLLCMLHQSWYTFFRNIDSWERNAILITITVHRKACHGAFCLANCSLLWSDKTLNFLLSDSENRELLASRARNDVTTVRGMNRGKKRCAGEISMLDTVQIFPRPLLIVKRLLAFLLESVSLWEYTQQS